MIENTKDEDIVDADNGNLIIKIEMKIENFVTHN